MGCGSPVAPRVLKVLNGICASKPAKSFGLMRLSIQPTSDCMLQTHDSSRDPSASLSFNLASPKDASLRRDDLAQQVAQEDRTIQAQI